MTQPPNAPEGDQPPEHQPQQFGQPNQRITGSGQSAGRPEDTQPLPPHGQGSADQPYAGAYNQAPDNPYNPYNPQQSGGPYNQPTGDPYNQYAAPPTPPPTPPPTAPTTAPTGPTGGGTPYRTWQPQQHSQRRISDANPLRAAFDFGFNSYATPGLVKIIYVLALIVAALWWIGGGLTGLIAGVAARGLGGGDGSVALGIIALLLGWIPALLWLLFVRIVLEASLALVRVADDARHIRAKIED
ncbi:DUF4282 domain-containing protein [Microlunatus sp. Gsoil 973]|uniref:DUF4282 domain-containing protein n=1 Tax=Microlunatus sp. Gsoil 973 TaxID=2672569 RepID=UPI0012B47947|nr:DUF4282 domain-containing protein [Microlunatus sp. Gsoil 973]QGN34675.1 DUF4282 domain-containing protein [Microlunatus sp. Gsoil 973]